MTNTLTIMNDPERSFTVFECGCKYDAACYEWLHYCNDEETCMVVKFANISQRSEEPLSWWMKVVNFFTPAA